VLVIAEALEPQRAAELTRLARSLELCVLLEVHTPDRLIAVLQHLPDAEREGVLIGVNNRDLHAQKVNLGTTEALAPLIPAAMAFVAESGIRTRADVERMHAAGARALLVGETLMRSGDPAAAIRALFG
jgi:indole-3-glycerol phosphate synthase